MTSAEHYTLLILSRRTGLQGVTLPNGVESEFESFFAREDLCARRLPCLIFAILSWQAGGMNRSSSGVSSLSRKDARPARLSCRFQLVCIAWRQSTLQKSQGRQQTPKPVIPQGLPRRIGKDVGYFQLKALFL